jgi:hypothetical protein
MDDHDVATLHVDDARASGPISIPSESLKRAIGLEDGIEVTDEQKPRAATRAAGHEMAGPIERLAVDPLGLEAERIEFGTKQSAHFTYAGEVHRSAVDVYRSLEQLDGLPRVGIDLSGDPHLDPRERLGTDGQRCSREQERE